MALEPSQYGSAAILNDRAIQERIAVAHEAQLGGQPIHSGVDAFSITYVFPLKDFGAGNWTEDIEGVPGYRGTVKAVCIYVVTEVFSTDTLQARVEVGIQGGDVDAYVDTADFGALAVAAALNPALTAGVVGTIPIGENIIVTGYAPTGGTPTGIASVALTIQYYR